jgi:hypothetical protein
MILRESSRSRTFAGAGPRALPILVVADAATSPPLSPSVRLAAQHFAAATLYLLAGAVGVVWIAPELTGGRYLAPLVTGVTHLFTLGWLTTTIFGALYQLLPGALGAPIRWPRVAHASFWTFAPSAGLFACGVTLGSTPLHHAGLALVAIGIVLALINIISSLRRSRMRDETWMGIALAITFLTSTFGLGVVLLHNLHTGFLAAARMRVLATHLHIALVGWALMMLVGVSHRLLPMFVQARGADTRWTRRALAMLTSGLVLLAVGFNARLTGLTWLATALLELGVACFLRQVYEFHRARVRKPIDVGIQFAVATLVFLAISAAVGSAVLFEGTGAPRLATVYVLLGLLGGLVLYVIGFFYKIAPQLAWSLRNRMGTRTVPAIADLFSSRLAVIQLGTMCAALATLAVSILAGSIGSAYAGAILFLAGVLQFAAQIIRMAIGGA